MERAFTKLEQQCGPQGMTASEYREKIGISTLSPARFMYVAQV